VKRAETARDAQRHSGGAEEDGPHGPIFYHDLQ
jgi:hypothetical protein